MDMKMKNYRKLTINPSFKSLIRPLSQQEYLQLEANIMADGCREPIVIWNGVIIDGHNRYEICSRHNLPFLCEEKEFSCKEEAIAWICANQLGRRNLTDETKKYLIGLQYDNKKIANNKKNLEGKNQYAGVSESFVKSCSFRNRTAQAIAEENNISHSTVEKYAIYSRAIKEIEKKSPELSSKILSGDYKVSHKNTLELANFPKETIQRIERRLNNSESSFSRYKNTRSEIQKSIRKRSFDPDSIIDGPSIKDMPEYDPDAELTGLTLTIPSWCSSITRVKDTSDFTVTSITARQNLRHELIRLKICVEYMLRAIKESANE